MGSLRWCHRDLWGLIMWAHCHCVPFQMGFFKRTRPPAEGDAQEPGQPQESGSAQD